MRPLDVEEIRDRKLGEILRLCSRCSFCKRYYCDGVGCRGCPLGKRQCRRFVRLVDQLFDFVLGVELKGSLK